MKIGQPKHEAPLPSLRGIRRACALELYRTVKRLKVHVPADLVKQAEERYVRKVALNLPWIAENRSDRRKLADWWEAEVCGEIAELWGVERARLAAAFRSAFGG